jgi:hypothetical protein
LEIQHARKRDSCGAANKITKYKLNLMKLTILNCIAIMFVLLAKNAESAEEVHASCVIPPNTYAFVSMDIGMMGRYSRVQHCVCKSAKHQQTGTKTDGA